jgi:hypothetical protein
MEECAEVSLARALINGADSMGGPAVDAASADGTQACPIGKAFS